jgi:hypothetical protein
MEYYTTTYVPLAYYTEAHNYHSAPAFYTGTPKYYSAPNYTSTTETVPTYYTAAASSHYGDYYSEVRSLLHQNLRCPQLLH